MRCGEPKLFDLSVPLSVRNRRIVEVQNVWRKKQGMKLLPIPETRKVPAVADAAVAPLLKTLVESSSAERNATRAQPSNAWDSGALPRVARELAALPKEHPARAVC